MKKSSFALLPALAAALLSAGCSDEVTVSYDMRTPFERELFSQGDYSTQNSVGEVVGTGMRWWLMENLIPGGEGGVTVWTRKFSAQKNLGYHRHSLPSELALKVPVRADVDEERMGEVKGFENFVSDVVDPLPVHPLLRAPLRKKELLARFDAEWRLWWRATHLLRGTFPRKGNVTALVPASDLAPLKVDSVFTAGVERIQNRDCLVYEIDYRLESAPDADLLFEQFLKADTTDGRAYADFKADSASAKGRWKIWIAPENGWLCREQDWQELTIVAEHRETGESRPVTARKAVERLYTYDPVEKGRTGSGR